MSNHSRPALVGAAVTLLAFLGASGAALAGDRHATVILNGKKIIDNKPLLGCTGGALWSDELRPGPIYLQGDHAGVEYRNVVLRPITR